MENPIKMDDLGVPLFLETPTCGYAWVGGEFQDGDTVVQTKNGM